jgi:hypothetical protein
MMLPLLRACCCCSLAPAVLRKSRCASGFAYFLVALLHPCNH